MNDKVEHLILEQLRGMRADMARMSDRMDTFAAEMRAIRHQHSAVTTLQEHDHEDLASIKVRLDRIERRLELVDDSGDGA
jgi:small-conductance mechanosensitive channel